MKKFFLKNERIYIFLAWFIILALIGSFILITKLSEVLNVPALRIMGFAAVSIYLVILGLVYIFSAIELYKNGKYEKRNAIILLLIGGGLHRIYNKQIAIAILYALTFGFFSIGFIYDLIKICTNDFKSTKFSDEEITEEPSKYSKTSISLFCLFLGVLGIHNFSCGRIAKGIIYLLTCGFFVIGVFIDLINIINNKYRDGQGKLIIK